MPYLAMQSCALRYNYSEIKANFTSQQEIQLPMFCPQDIVRMPTEHNHELEIRHKSSYEFLMLIPQVSGRK